MNRTVGLFGSGTKHQDDACLPDQANTSPSKRCKRVSEAAVDERALPVAPNAARDDARETRPAKNGSRSGRLTAMALKVEDVVEASALRGAAEAV